MSDFTGNEQFHEPSRERLLKQQMERILIKLKNDPTTITTEDACRLSENYDVNDLKSARIISAVEAFAVANREVHDLDIEPVQALHNSLLDIVQKLHTAVEHNPHIITLEMLHTTKDIVSMMQQAVGKVNTLPPGVKAKLRRDIAQVEPKVADCTLIQAKAGHLHSQETHAQCHNEEGDFMAIAHSVIAKGERQQPLSASSSCISAHSQNYSKSSFSPQVQSIWRHTKYKTPPGSEVHIKVNTGPIIAQADADVFLSREMRSRGQTDGGGLTATSPSLVHKEREESHSDQSNISPRVSEPDHERCKEFAHYDRDFNLKVIEKATTAMIRKELENFNDSTTGYVQPHEHQIPIHAKRVGSDHKGENRQPILESK